MTLAQTSTKTEPRLNLLLRMVGTDRIKTSSNPRNTFDPVLLKELAGSIDSLGLQSPPICQERGEFYDVLDGGRRVRACRDLLGWKEMPILVIPQETDGGPPLARQLVCNLQRADLNAIERALGIDSLMTQANLSAEAVAKMLGLSNASVTRSLSILKLPDVIRNLVADGEIPADSAYQLSTVSDPAQQAALAAEVAGKRLTRDALARKLKSSRRSDERRAAGSTRCTALLGKCAVTFDGPGLSIDTMIEWVEQLLTRARKAKSQGLTLETFVRALRDQSTEGKGGKP